MPDEFLPWLMIVGVAVAAAAVHSALGFGSGSLLVPVLLAVVEPAAAVIAAALVGMAVNVPQLLTERRRPHVPVGDLAPLWFAALPGCVFGALLAGAISSTVLAVPVAAVLVLSATTLFFHPASEARLPVAAMGCRRSHHAHPLRSPASSVRCSGSYWSPPASGEPHCATVSEQASLSWGPWRSPPLSP